MRNNTISIVGGTGTLGTNLSKDLSQLLPTHQIITLSRTAENSKKSNLDNIKVLNFDITESQSYDTSLAGTGILIICLASPPSSAYKIEYKAVVKLATWAAKNNVEKIIYISGITAPNAPRWFQNGYAKKNAEIALKKLEIPVHILRPSWTMESLSKMIREDKVSIIGKGNSLIHWVSTSDIAKIIEAIVKSNNRSHTEWNILGPEEIALKHAVVKFGKAKGINSSPSILPIPIARLISIFDENLKAITQLTRMYQMFDETDVKQNLPSNLQPKETLEQWTKRL